MGFTVPTGTGATLYERGSSEYESTFLTVSKTPVK